MNELRRLRGIGSPKVRRHNRVSQMRGLYWTIQPADGIRAATLPEPARIDETVSAQAFHMVEWPDVRHAIVDLAVRRTGRPGRTGQPLLPHPWRGDRSIARLRAALGDLQWLRGGLAHSTVMARLDPPHRRSCADRRGLPAARLGKAAHSQPDGYANGLPASRLDPGSRPPPQGHRRLSALEAGELKFNRRHSGARAELANPESRGCSARFRVQPCRAAPERRVSVCEQRGQWGHLSPRPCVLAVIAAQWLILRRWETIASVSGNSSRLPRFAAATE